MTTISGDELRQDPAGVLERVAAGESFDITDKGSVVAVIAPPRPTSELDRLRALGQVREATGSRADLANIRRITSSWTTQEMIDDLRGDR